MRATHWLPEFPRDTGNRADPALYDTENARTTGEPR
ncbi:hypothetical protein F4561_002461 [Lipingzhangella halophila]|uniref:Uncharacterized protein n=1 Tax=Lipingzhangella halophila TaxID=1783352 RepID=A0A7W7RGM4_9ACTN|nr:hypothetical protein [Lipingzhangella halophila]